MFNNCNSCGLNSGSCCLGSSIDKQSAKLSSSMGEAWTSFARTGSPNSEGQESAAGVQAWPKFTINRTIMQFDSPSKLKTDSRSEYCSFWQTVYDEEQV